jgi:hypothetical protein
MLRLRRHGLRKRPVCLCSQCIESLDDLLLARAPTVERFGSKFSALRLAAVRSICG